jgi:phosphoglycolate phosphatase
MFGERRFLAVGFDMDSTLLNTNIDYYRLRRVVSGEMRKAGVPEDLIDDRDLSKFNLDRGIRYLTANGRADEIDGILIRIDKEIRKIELKNSDSAKAYDGADRMLRYLKGKGYKIGVLTRANRQYAVKALTLSGVIDLLDAIVCKDDFHESESKPSAAAMHNLAKLLGVASKDVLYLGDNKLDHHCARDAGAGFIGVLTKYTENDWKDVDADVKIIGTVTDLMKIL